MRYQKIHAGGGQETIILLQVLALWLILRGVRFLITSIDSQCFVLTHNFTSACGHGNAEKLESDWTHLIQGAGTI